MGVLPTQPLHGLHPAGTGSCHRTVDGRPQFEGEDWGIGILGYADGTQVVIEGNYVTPGGMDDYVECYGSDGVIKVEMTFGSPLSVYSRKGFGYAIEKADFTHGWTRPAVDEHANLGYTDELAHFLKEGSFCVV